jgi:hypothetical protein
MAVVQQRPVVEVPDQAGDRPVWARVGVIAVIGFVVGIAWPRLAGVRLGPVPPDEGKGNAAAQASGSAVRPTALAASAASVPTPVSGSAPAPASGAPAAGIGVSAGKVLSCRNAKGKSLDDCDNPDFETVSGPRLKSLAKCPAALGLNGKLSIGFDLDFSRNRIKLVRGKSTTVPAAASTGIFQCLETEFQKAKLDEVTHQQARYTIFYTVQFVPPGKAADIEPAAEKRDPGDQEEAKPQEAGIGSGQVVYDTVLVRDEPKEGKVVARLVRGTRVELLSRKGGWYKIRFGDREGWVYRGSVAQ